MLIDLHVHSSVSDGSYSPAQLIDVAAEQGIGVIALCDHDTTAGITDFTRYGSIKHITAIPGVEISATWENGNCHILGLGISNNHEPLESTLVQIREARSNRNLRIIKKLNSLGIGITFEQVQDMTEGDIIARPHIARAIHNSGYVASVQEAFDRFLAKGAPAYVDRFRLDPQPAVQLLHDAGAIPVLAHPSQLQVGIDVLDGLIQRLKPCGLMGLEVYTPYSSEIDIISYTTIAEKHNLFVCGGSDFHGETKPDHRLGYYQTGKPIPEQCAEIIKSLKLIVNG